MATKADKSLLLDTAQPSTRRRLYRVVRLLPEGMYAIDIARKKWKVGDGQRGYYWGYLIVEVGKLINKDKEATDKVLNALFLSEQWVIASQPVTVVRSLSDLDPAAASTYFEDIVSWVWIKFKTRLTEPDPAKRTNK